MFTRHLDEAFPTYLDPTSCSTDGLHLLFSMSLFIPPHAYPISPDKTSDFNKMAEHINKVSSWPSLCVPSGPAITQYTQQI